VSGATLIVVLVCAGLGVVAVLSSALRSGKPTPATPSVPATPTTPTVKKRPAPTFLGHIMGSPWYGFGQRIVMSVSPRATTCEDNGPNTPKKQTHGIVDNGSGPYQWRMRVIDIGTDKERSVFDFATAKEMPVYLQEGNATGRECTGEWVDWMQGLVFYALGKCPYRTGALVNCNEFIPIEAYAVTKSGAKAKGAVKPKKCGCGGTGSGGAAGTDPTKPTTTVRIITKIRNADGVESIQYFTDIIVETRSCD